MEELKNLAENLLKLRKRAGKTQKEVAADVEITAAALSSYENGRKQPQLDYLVRLANYYGVTLDWLCGLEDKTEMLGSDYLRYLTKLCEVEGIPVEVTVTSIPWREYPYLEEDDIDIYEEVERETGKKGKLKYVTLNIYDQMASEFCDTYRKYLELYRGGHMDKELFELWKKDRFNQVIYPI